MSKSQENLEQYLAVKVLPDGNLFVPLLKSRPLTIEHASPDLYDIAVNNWITLHQIESAKSEKCILYIGESFPAFKRESIKTIGVDIERKYQQKMFDGTWHDVDYDEMDVEERVKNNFRVILISMKEKKELSQYVYGRGWASELASIRNRLYHDLPKGKVDEWELLKVVKAHLANLDTYINQMNISLTWVKRDEGNPIDGVQYMTITEDGQYRIIVYGSTLRGFPPSVTHYMPLIAPPVQY